jgi:hypothetical protein
MGPRGAWLLAPVLALSSACVAPAPSYGAYEGKAEATAQSALSAVETARVAVVTAAKDDVFLHYLSVVVSQAEDTATAVQGTFDSVQPPDTRSDALRSDLDDRLQAAVSVLGDVRIAARRHDISTVVGKLGDLAKASDSLRAFSEAHQ